ncbi:GDSL-type esterase/lipase family protein, partial [Kitasatospora sp. NPDC057518]|uniref:GDSL-type esterase/lipase family protein n=1 Tax=Kitasatospora sp. NPDC057518 TaxID=3346155 RepID=UPI0036B4BF03
MTLVVLAGPAAQAQPRELAGQRNIITWNMQGATAAGTGGTYERVHQIYSRAVDDAARDGGAADQQRVVMALQEAGVPPTSWAALTPADQGDLDIPAGLRGYRRKVGRTYSYLFLAPTTGSDPSGRVNSAIITNQLPQRLVYIPAIADRLRPLIGVGYGEGGADGEYYFSFHASSGNGGRDIMGILRGLTEEMGLLESTVHSGHSVNWYIGGDFNVSPDVLRRRLDGQQATDFFIAGPEGHTHRGASKSTLDYVVTNDPSMSRVRGVVTDQEGFSDHDSVSYGWRIGGGMPCDPLRATVRAAAEVTGPALAPCPLPRPAAIVSMGDSYISGEGGRWAGNGDYPSSGSGLGTDRAVTDCTGEVAEAETCRYDLTKVYGGTSYQGGNACDRSDVAEIKGVDLYGIPPANRFNIACSGAETKHVRSEGFKGEAPQVQQLRELAKQQDVKVIALSVGGNDLDFSGILNRCAQRFLLGRGACHEGEDAPLKSKVAGLQGSVEGTVDDIRAAMRDAGYEDGDYTLVVQSYPSPFPQPLGMRETGDTYDRYTKAGFPFYDEDAAWTNRTVTPAISDALKKAAVAKKAVFLDPRSAFAGHELNSKDARTAGVENSPQSPLAADAAEWVRWVDHLPGVPSTRKQGEAQEFVHPNAFGQQALSECLSQTVRQHDAHPQYGTFACDGRAGAAPGAVTVRHTGLEGRDPWDAPKLTVMPLGDSITQGRGSANDSLGYRKELWQALKDHTGSLDFVGSLKHGDGGFDGDHEGHSGWRIDELTDNAGYREGDLDTWLPAAKPNVITLMAGTNDLNRGAPTTPQDARDRMDTLLGKIHAMAPDATVVLGSVPPTDPATPWVRFQPLFDAYNKLLPPLVDSWRGKGMKVRFADMGAVTAGDMRGGDGLHPTPSGYTKIADAFYEGVAAAAADGWITENVAVKPAPYSGGVLGDGPVDIDGDGKADYLVVGDDGSVEAWLNRGTDAKGGGGWQSVGRIAAGVAPGGKVRFADLDGDGKADYLVLNDDGSVQAWLNRGTDMPGGTGAPGGGGGMDPSTGSGGTTGTGTPGGGGGMDPSGGSGGTTGTPAGGGWQAIGTVAAGVAPGGKVRFADVNGDGKADYLVVEDDGSVSAWLNTDGRGGWNGVGRIAAGVATGDKVR